MNLDKNKVRFKNKFCLAPQWSFRLMICGNSGCGKTNLLLKLIYDYLYLQLIYLYAKDLEEDRYKDLMININVVEEKTNKDLIFVSNDQSDIIDVDDLDPKVHNLVILTILLQEKIKNIVIKPKIIRINCNYFLFFKCYSPKEID